jgi:hypothetical protein
MNELPLDRTIRLQAEYMEMWCRWGGSPPAHGAREMADIATELAALHEEQADIYHHAANALTAIPGFATGDKGQ